MHEVVTQKESDAVILGHGLFLQRDGAVELLDARRRGAGAALHNYLFFQMLANVAGAFGKGEVDGRDIGAALGYGAHQALLCQAHQRLAHGCAAHIQVVAKLLDAQLFARLVIQIDDLASNGVVGLVL